MSNHARKTLTKTEIKALQKDIENGVPPRTIATALNLRLDCVFNFVKPEVARKVKARENVLKREEQRLRELEASALAEEAKLLEEEEKALAKEEKELKDKKFK